jgi:putative aldouronate transport system permease protein
MIYKRNIGDRVFNGVNYFFLILIGFLCLYPMIYILAVSLSGSMAVLNRRVFLWPVDFNIEAYKTCFESKTLAKAYLNTILYTTSGTALNLIAVTLMAYPLSKRRLIGRRPISFFFYFTNLFSGGLIPTFLVVKSLNFVDKIWALIVPGCVSVFYAIILRTNFESIPADLEEAAQIDGMGNWKILANIYIPLNIPTYATLILFFAIGHWNSFFQPLIYINSSSKYPLQVILRNIVIANTMNDLSVSATGTAAFTDMRVIGETLKAATIIIVVAPIVLIYPFVQKYFVKGIMIGAVKG